MVSLAWLGRGCGEAELCVGFPGAKPLRERLWWALGSHREKGHRPHSISRHAHSRASGSWPWASVAGPSLGHTVAGCCPCTVPGCKATGPALSGRLGHGRPQQSRGSCRAHSHGPSEGSSLKSTFLTIVRSYD